MTSLRFETTLNIGLDHHPIERKAVVRAMAYVLAVSTASLDDPAECDILLSVPEIPGAEPLYSRAEVEDCLDEACKEAVIIRKEREERNVAA